MITFFLSRASNGSTVFISKFSNSMAGDLWKSVLKVNRNKISTILNLPMRKLTSPKVKCFRLTRCHDRTPTSKRVSGATFYKILSLE